MSDDVRPIKESLNSIVYDHKVLSTMEGSSATFGYDRERRGNPSGLPTGGYSEAREIEKLVARVAKVIRAQRLRAEAKQPKNKDMTAKAIRAERGRPASELAFIYRLSQEQVEIYMLEVNLDPKTGLPKEKNLTAPAGEAIRAYTK